MTVRRSSEYESQVGRRRIVPARTVPAPNLSQVQSSGNDSASRLDLWPRRISCYSRIVSGMDRAVVLDGIATLASHFANLASMACQRYLPERHRSDPGEHT